MGGPSTEGFLPLSDNYVKRRAKGLPNEWRLMVLHSLAIYTHAFTRYHTSQSRCALELKYDDCRRLLNPAPWVASTTTVVVTLALCLESEIATTIVVAITP